MGEYMLTLFTDAIDEKENNFYLLLLNRDSPRRESFFSEVVQEPKCLEYIIDSSIKTSEKQIEPIQESLYIEEPQLPIEISLDYSHDEYKPPISPIITQAPTIINNTSPELDSIVVPEEEEEEQQEQEESYSDPEIFKEPEVSFDDVIDQDDTPEFSDDEEGEEDNQSDGNLSEAEFEIQVDGDIDDKSEDE